MLHSLDLIFIKLIFPQKRFFDVRFCDKTYQLCLLLYFVNRLFRENTTILNMQNIPENWIKWHQFWRVINDNFLTVRFDKFWILWLNFKNFQFVPVFTVRFDLTRNSTSSQSKVEPFLQLNWWDHRWVSGSDNICYCSVVTRLPSHLSYLITQTALIKKTGAPSFIIDIFMSKSETLNQLKQSSARQDISTSRERHILGVGLNVSAFSSKFVVINWEGGTWMQ